MTELTLETMDGMTRPELMQIAQDRFGLSFTARSTKGDIIDSLAFELGLKVPAAQVAADEQAEDKPPEKLWLRVHVSDKDNESQDVFVNVQGRQMLIKRGQWVQVLPEVIEALRNAVQTVYDRVPSREFPGRVELIPREAPSYPFETRAA
jgi:hypothetical protein